jgi:hypothetical protein
VNKEKILAVSVVVFMVAVEAAISTFVGASGDSTLAGVILFIGLEAMRHWRIYMKQS